MAKIKQEIELVSKKGRRVFVVLQSAPETLASLTNKEDCDGEEISSSWF